MHQTLLLWKSRSPKGFVKGREKGDDEKPFYHCSFAGPLPPENDPNADDYFLPPFAHTLPSSGWSKLVTLISFQHARWWTDKSWRRCEAFFLLGKSSKSHSQYEVPFATAISTKSFFFLMQRRRQAFFSVLAPPTNFWCGRFFFFCYCSKVSARAISHRLHLIFAAASVENILRKFHTLPTLKKAFASSF